MLKKYLPQFRRLNEIIFMFSILVLASSSIVANAAVISVNASNTNLIVGESVNVNLDISGLSATSVDSLSAFDLDILFDDSVFAFTGFSFIDPDLGNNQLELVETGAFPFDGDVIDLGFGMLDVYGVSGNSDTVLDSAQANSFRFLGLTFTTIAEAISSSITIDLSDPLLLVLDSTFGDLGVSYLPSEAVLSVSSASSNVPEPNIIFLFSAGFLLLLTITRKRYITIGR